MTAILVGLRIRLVALGVGVTGGEYLLAHLGVFCGETRGQRAKNHCLRLGNVLVVKLGTLKGVHSYGVQGWRNSCLPPSRGRTH